MLTSNIYIHIKKIVLLIYRYVNIYCIYSAMITMRMYYMCKTSGLINLPAHKLCTTVLSRDTM